MHLVATNYYLIDATQRLYESLHVTRHTLHVTRYTLHVTRYTSHITHHTSPSCAHQAAAAVAVCVPTALQLQQCWYVRYAICGLVF